MTTTEAGLATLNFGQAYVRRSPILRPRATCPGSPLLEAVGDPHLARRGGHGARRGAVARRPAPSLRRRGAGEGRRRLARAARAMIMRLIRLALLAALALGSAAALAVQPDEVMKDPTLEARARALSEELRCLVWSTSRIHGTIQTRLWRATSAFSFASGSRKAKATTPCGPISSRYGDFVLLKPPFKPEILPSWLSPALVLARSRRRALCPPLRAPRDARSERRARGTPCNPHWERRWGNLSRCFAA